MKPQFSYRAERGWTVATRRCWASALGNCKGRINREHYFTRSLFTGDRITVDGAPWLGGLSKTIGLDAATAHILCEHHNSALGATADATGKDLRQLLVDSVQASPARVDESRPWIQRPSGVLLPRPEVTLSGAQCGAWLCKTHCDVTAVSGGEPDRNYVEYAFGHRPVQKPYFYYPHVEGENVRFVDYPHLTYVDFQEPGEPFGVQVCGLWAVVALEPLLGSRFLDRTREFRFEKLVLRFDWSDEPV